MQFAFHWESISLYVPQVCDLYFQTTALYIVAVLVAALRVRKVIRDRKASK